MSIPNSLFNTLSKQLKKFCHSKYCRKHYNTCPRPHLLCALRLNGFTAMAWNIAKEIDFISHNADAYSDEFLLSEINRLKIESKFFQHCIFLHPPAFRHKEEMKRLVQVCSDIKLLCEEIQEGIELCGK